MVSWPEGWAPLNTIGLVIRSVILVIRQPGLDQTSRASSSANCSQTQSGRSLRWAAIVVAMGEPHHLHARQPGRPARHFRNPPPSRVQDGLTPSSWQGVQQRLRLSFTGTQLPQARVRNSRADAEGPQNGLHEVTRFCWSPRPAGNPALQTARRLWATRHTWPASLQQTGLIVTVEQGRAFANCSGRRGNREPAGSACRRRCRPRYAPRPRRPLANPSSARGTVDRQRQLRALSIRCHPDRTAPGQGAISDGHGQARAHLVDRRLVIRLAEDGRARHEHVGTRLGNLANVVDPTPPSIPGECRGRSRRSGGAPGAACRGCRG